jgi:4-hydroxy-3-polyprenylbenzoate decarboxylase
METGRIVVGVTGASGAIYAQRFVRQAARHFREVYLTLSPQAAQVAETELGVRLWTEPFDVAAWLGAPAANVRVLDRRDYFTPPASGSFRHDGMVVVPCSMGTAGRIANGVSDDLLTRAADVCLKERRRLVVVPREMPMNLIMLRNLAALAEAGAVVLPACPAWYHRPASLEELADTVVARILQQFGIDHDLAPEWAVDEGLPEQEGPETA